MKLPKFILGDNTDFPNATYVVHTAYPRFIVNLENDEVEWLEEFTNEDEEELTILANSLLQEALEFYDREIARYEP